MSNNNTNRTRFNKSLLDLAVNTINGLSEKSAFVPAPPQQPGGMPGGTPMTDPSAMNQMQPPPDPSQGMGGPQMPMPDPSALGAGGAGGGVGGVGGGAPMDPSAMQQSPQVPMGPDGLPMAGVSQDAPTQSPQGNGGIDPDALKSAIRETLQETGVIKPQKLKPDDHYQHLLTVLKSIAETIGAKVPDYTPADSSGSGNGNSNGSKDSKQQASMGTSSTEALSNAGINPVQPTDPGMFAANGASNGSQQAKAASNNPSLRSALSRLRGK